MKFIYCNKLLNVTAVHMFSFNYFSMLLTLPNFPAEKKVFKLARKFLNFINHNFNLLYNDFGLIDKNLEYIINLFCV